MKSPNTIYVVYLLFCLLITSASAQSLIRQSTDDPKTTPQQENGAKSDTNLREAHYLDKYDDLEISSRDYKVSPSNAVTGMRDRPPMSYSLKIESFETLFQSPRRDRYQSGPFPAGGYNWSLIIFPNGNRLDGGQGFISLYVAIDNSTLIFSHEEVIADIRFYVFSRSRRQFFTMQATNVWRYNVFKTMWGFPQVMSVATFRDPRNGYLFDGDHCEFGVDVTIPTTFQRSEIFTVARNFPNPRFTWSIQRFSTLLGEIYFSDVFSVGGRNWNIQLYPTGFSTGEGRFLSMYLILNANESLRPHESVYVRAQLRGFNQLASPRTIDRPINDWIDRPGRGSGWGYPEFISLADLRDSRRGYVVNDTLRVQVEILAVSSTRYLPR